MSQDIIPMGPHALASRHSRALAMKSFGVDPVALSLYRAQNRSVAQQNRSKRALMIQKEHALITQEENILPMVI